MSVNLHILHFRTFQEFCFYKLYIFLADMCLSLDSTGEFTERVWKISCQIFATLYTLFIYPSLHTNTNSWDDISEPFSWIPLCKNIFAYSVISKFLFLVFKRTCPLLRIWVFILHLTQNICQAWIWWLPWVPCFSLKWIMMTFWKIILN